MSLLARFLQRFRSTTQLVGHDLQGNKFYESPSAFGDGSRPRRTVQYSDPEAVYDYIGGQKRLPVQWSMWLSHTRSHPPTPEELQSDIERQRRVLANVAMIEAREQAQKLLSSNGPLPIQNPPEPSRSPNLAQSKTDSPWKPAPESWKPAPESWQPESWTPQPSRKAS